MSFPLGKFLSTAAVLGTAQVLALGADDNGSNPAATSTADAAGASAAPVSSQPAASAALAASPPADAPADAPLELPRVVVTAARVANPAPADSFQMPVSALRFDPLVDAQTRGIAEGQSDVSIRGGTFESTGFVIEGLPLYAPQTGHYAADLPISPAFLGEPEVRTGAANAQTGWNATAGTVAHTWIPVAPGGALGVTLGDRHLLGFDARAAFLANEKLLGRTLALELAAAHSQGDGPFGNEPRVRADGTPYGGGEFPFSDHSFQRLNARLQLRDATSQTDLFAGHQTKDYAWPNLYAKGQPGPLWRDEREDIRNQLYLLTHKQELRHGDYLRLGLSHAITRDHYRIPVLATYHARHTTTATAATVDGRATLLPNPAGGTALRYRAGIIADTVHSNTLTAGRYNSRTLATLSLHGDHALPLTPADGTTLILTAGLTLDEANRERGALSPAAAITWKTDAPAALLRRATLDYSESTQLPSYMALNSAPGLFGGNRNLGRARARTAQLTAQLTPANWTLSPAIFYRHDDGLADWVFARATTGSRAARAVDIHTAGAELTARRSWKHLDLTLGYTHLHKTDNYTSDVLGSFYAADYARHRLTAALVLRLPHGLELRCDNEFRVQQKNRLRTGPDAPLLTTLALHWRVPAVPGLALTAQVDNLWNTHYQDVPLVPAVPRTLSARAEYRW